jgi:hypothetical protein
MIYFITSKIFNHFGIYPTIRQKQWLSSTVVTISAHYFNELSFTHINKLGSIADLIM